MTDEQFIPGEERNRRARWRSDDDPSFAVFRHRIDEDVEPEHIHIPEGRRPVDEVWASAIAEDIKVNGFTSVVIVYWEKIEEHEDGGRYVLIDGAHRIRAAIFANHAVRVLVTARDANPDAIEQAANLFRNELSEAERKLALKKYKDSWEAHRARLAEAQQKREAEREGEIAAWRKKNKRKIEKERTEWQERTDARCAETSNGGRPRSFATLMSSAFGESKSQINRDVADGEKIAARLESGEARTADEALEQIKQVRVLRVSPPEPKPPPKLFLVNFKEDEAPPRVPNDLQRLRAAWDAASPETRRTFLSEVRNTPEAHEMKQ